MICRVNQKPGRRRSIRVQHALAAGVVFAFFCTAISSAQNVADYSSIDNPTLLLLREPAVFDDLRLAADQREAIERLNARQDATLLATRNRPADQAATMLAELFAATQTTLGEVLSNEQRTRLDEIICRTRGIKTVLAADVAAQLGLSDSQRESIEKILADTRDEIQELSDKLRSGTPPADIQRQATAARRREQRQVLGELSDTQRRQLAQLFGRDFDLTRLGRVRFKAPEFDQSSEWINSHPLTLESLRGNVVVVHFWAFGCINCQRNFPWYRQWYDKFAGRPLVIVGIHTPETEAERSVDSLRRRVDEAGFKFPVIVDNDKHDWNNWGNSMWPSVYLIDKRGYLRYWWYGELNWQAAAGQETMAKRIEELLAE